MTTTQRHFWRAAGNPNQHLIIEPDRNGHPTIAAGVRHPGSDPLAYPVTINAPGLAHLIELAEAVQEALEAARNAHPDARFVDMPGTPTQAQYDAAKGTVHMNGTDSVSIHVRRQIIRNGGIPWVADVFTSNQRGNYSVPVYRSDWTEVVAALKELQGA